MTIDTSFFFSPQPPPPRDDQPETNAVYVKKIVSHLAASNLYDLVWPGARQRRRLRAIYDCNYVAK